MQASSPALGRAAAIVTAGTLALGLASCAGASTPPPAATSEPEVEVAVVVAPEATVEPAAASTEVTVPAPARTVFHVNRHFKDDPQLLLTRVTKRPEGLTLDFVFTNKGTTVLTIKVSPAGDPNAMFVALPDGQRLEFKSAEGISVKPNLDRVEPGEKQRFSVTFDPLPDDVTKFDVYEGVAGQNAVRGQSQFWFFRNIQLK